MRKRQRRKTTKSPPKVGLAAITDFLKEKNVVSELEPTAYFTPKEEERTAFTKII